VSAPHGGDQRPSPDWRERLLGGRDRLGWWLLPLFVMVGLGGAVLAGSLAVVYYAQQVSQLESETREAREQLIGAADEVREAADEALAAIDEEVESVREELARGLPLEDALEVGVVRLEVDARLEGEAQQQPEPESQVEPATFRPQAARAAPEDDEDPDDEQPEDDEEPEAEEEVAPPADPAPRREIPLRRSGTGFVVVVDGGTAFVVTSLGLLDDPRTDERVPADVEVTARLSAGSTTATVHSWDESNDLLLLRASIGNVDPLPWREQNDALEPGDRLIAVGATPGLEPVRVGSEVAAVSGRALVTSLPALQLLSGGPVVDVDGRVVGIAIASHAALGGDPVVVPIHRLCDELLSTCPE
jgi:S1-C subfamily serine protease